MKVTILGGAGGVGASTAFNLALLRRPFEIVLVDSRPELLTSHVMELDQVLELSPELAALRASAEFVRATV